MDTHLSYKEPLHNYRSRYYNSILLSIFGVDVDLDVGADVGADLDEGAVVDAVVENDFLFFY
jgi:hypothetical protein